MLFLAASVFLKALGWALINSIWQFAICWLVYRFLTVTITKMPAAAKHTIALCLLFSGTILFIIECGSYFANQASVINGNGWAIENPWWYNSWHAAGNYADALIPYLSLFYLACVMLLFMKLCFFVRRAVALQHAGVTKITAPWILYIKNVSVQLGIQQTVKTFLSIHIDTPQVVGFLKPVILIPAACLTNLTTNQLEAILLHELVHIKRNDCLINLLVAAAEILFFFNPFVKLLTGDIRKEREYSCDDMVLQFQHHPADYAAALLTLEKNRLMPVMYGMAASGKNQRQLLARIERIVGATESPRSFYLEGAGLLALVLLLLVVFIHPAKTSFDTSNRLTNGSYPAVAALLQHNSNGYAPPKHSGSRTIAKEDHTNKKIGHAKADNIAEGGGTSAYADMITIAASEENNDAPSTLIDATSKESRDFSLDQHGSNDLPPVPNMPAATEEPYIPSTSFSYRFTQDTALPKIKGQTYNERKAREALLKTQKALAQVNWKRIEKELKWNPREASKLKKELVQQLQNINWQRIELDVQDEQNQAQTDQLQEAVQQEQAIKLYRQHEALYEALQRQLTEQEQVIKTSGQRMQEDQKAANEQRRKLEMEMKKRRIIYI